MIFQVNGSTRLLEFLEDAYYFTRENRYIADLAPLQLYASGLTFAPECSQVKILSKDYRPRWLVLPPQVDEEWDVDRLTLKGHTSKIRVMAFSPDETYFATCSDDDTIRIWEPTTGDCITTFPSQLQSDQDEMNQYAMSFSGNNHCLAVAIAERLPRISRTSRKSISHTYHMMVYDMKAGSIVRKSHRMGIGGRERYPNTPADYYTESTISVAFMPNHDNTLYVATFANNVLEVWVLQMESNISKQVWSIDILSIMDENLLSEADCIPNRAGLAISTDHSLVSCGLNLGGSIATWHLDSGVLFSKHYTEPYRHTSGLLAFHEGDLLFDSRFDVVREGINLLRLNIQTGHVSEVARIGALSWFLRPTTTAIACARALFAFVADENRNADLFQMHSLPQAVDMEIETHTQSPLESAHSTTDGKTLCLRYPDRVELQDICGSVLFRSGFKGYFTGQFGVSDDGSVVVVGTVKGTHVYYVDTGRVLQLPGFLGNTMPPVFSSDKRLVALHSSNKHLGLEDRIVLWDLVSHKEFRSIDLPGLVLNYKMGSGAHWMIFSEDDKTLFTSSGCIDVVTGEFNTESVPRQGGGPFSLGKYKTWIRFNGENLLWLPQQYRSWSEARSAGAKHTVAFVGRNGKLVLMRFAEPG